METDTGGAVGGRTGWSVQALSMPAARTTRSCLERGLFTGWKYNDRDVNSSAGAMGLSAAPSPFQKRNTRSRTAPSPTNQIHERHCARCSSHKRLGWSLGRPCLDPWHPLNPDDV